MMDLAVRHVREGVGLPAEGRGARHPETPRSPKLGVTSHHNNSLTISPPFLGNTFSFSSLKGAISPRHCIYSSLIAIFIACRCHDEVWQVSRIHHSHSSAIPLVAARPRSTHYTITPALTQDTWPTTRRQNGSAHTSTTARSRSRSSASSRADVTRATTTSTTDQVTTKTMAPVAARTTRAPPRQRRQRLRTQSAPRRRARQSPRRRRRALLLPHRRQGLRRAGAR